MSADLFSFSNRTALITGGGSGIAAPAVIIPVVGDVSTREGCKTITEAFEEGEKKAGVDASEIKLDLLFNNAGVGHTEGFWTPDATPEQIRDALLTTTDSDWAHEFAVNAAAVQWMSAYLLPHLVKAAKTNDGFRDGRGCIVVNTSVSAFYHAAPQHVYASSKAAAHSITQSLASKFTRLGVRVNSIAVANVPSEMNDPNDPRSLISQVKDAVPIGRIGNEDDMVGAVLYLSSRAASFVSGTVIMVDGGIMANR